MIGVKICGVCRPEDARRAVRAGATHVGVIVGAGGPRRRSLAQAAVIFAAAEGAERVGVFADADPQEVVDVASTLGVTVVQLHGAESPDIVARVAESGPWVVWRAVRPATAAELRAELAIWRDAVDGLLVDGAGRGGTGTRAPWHDLAGARWSGAPRLVLAGGLGPHNIAEAVGLLAPDVVDVSSGVERQVGEKDEARMHAFVAAAREAARTMTQAQESAR